MEATQSALEKLRIIVNWAGYQSEYFNDKFKTMEDIIKAYDYAITNDLEFLDSEYLYSYLEDEELIKVRKDMLELLGYNVY